MTQPDQVRRDVTEHLLLHFTDMTKLNRVPVFERGDGCYIVDVNGKRYIDGLSGLYCTNLGHGYGARFARAAGAQLQELGYVSSWTVAHPRAAQLARRIAERAPEPLNRVFFTSGGSEAVEAAWKLARQWHAARGEPQRRKAIARQTAYHGTSLGALSFTGIPAVRNPFDPPAIPVRHVANTNAYRHPQGDDPAALCAALLAEIESVIEFEGSDSIAMLIAEPVQNAGGCLVPPPGYWRGLREICDRYGILLCSDEVICAWGRLGAWFGAERLNYQPDLLTFAKGLTAAQFAMGGVLVQDRVAEPFLSGDGFYMHGLTFGGHPVGAALALETIAILEEDQVLENVRDNEEWLDEHLNALRDIPIVGDVRGMGHFWAIELVKDRDTRDTFSGADAEWLLGEVLSEHLAEHGLICRLDDRADPVVQIAPPLVADRAVLGELVEILRAGLTHAAERAFAGRV